jgi:hypothetical protein
MKGEQISTELTSDGYVNCHDCQAEKDQL